MKVLHGDSELAIVATLVEVELFNQIGCFCLYLLYPHSFASLHFDFLNLLSHILVKTDLVCRQERQKLIHLLFELYVHSAEAF